MQPTLRHVQYARSRDRDEHLIESGFLRTAVRFNQWIGGLSPTGLYGTTETVPMISIYALFSMGRVNYCGVCFFRSGSIAFITVFMMIV